MSLCVSCNTPLILTLDPTETGSSASSVPDDVTLRCACHFHWQCLVDDYVGEGHCPNCVADITTTSAGASTSSASQDEPAIFVTLHNEGGLQQNLDIQPLLREEVYLKAHPAEQQARGFLELVREGDEYAIAQLLHDAADSGAADGDSDDAMDEDGEDEGESDDGDVAQLPLPALLRYQDPLEAQRSALHIAVMAENVTVVWLLLLLASELSLEAFPEIVMQTATQMGFAREAQDGLPDIRSLRDATGRTAWDLVSDGAIERRMLDFDVGLLMPP